MDGKATPMGRGMVSRGAEISVGSDTIWETGSGTGGRWAASRRR